MLLLLRKRAAILLVHNHVVVLLLRKRAAIFLMHKHVAVLLLLLTRATVGVGPLQRVLGQLLRAWTALRAALGVRCAMGSVPAAVRPRPTRVALRLWRVILLRKSGISAAQAVLHMLVQLENKSVAIAKSKPSITVAEPLAGAGAGAARLATLSVLGLIGVATLCAFRASVAKCMVHATVGPVAAAAIAAAAAAYALVVNGFLLPVCEPDIVVGLRSGVGPGPALEVAAAMTGKRRRRRVGRFKRLALPTRAKGRSKLPRPDHVGGMQGHVLWL